MQMQPFSVRFFRFALSTFAALLLVAGIASAQETVIYSFYSTFGDALPIGGLTADASGNLYGTTFYGGVYGNGMVYRLSPGASGWQISVLYSFNPNGTDGWGPSSPPVFDAQGNLYGSTEFGGTGSCSIFGCGTVYELSPTGDATWKETILHNFNDSDGKQIHAGLIIDSFGNLYGMATGGGVYASGTVFELSPSGGTWNFSLLHQFFGGTDGAHPLDALTLDGAGNLYGTTYEGGGTSAACKYGCGTVFKLSPANGTWTETTLHNFTTSTTGGASPTCKLTIDAAGNLYGTTSSGGGALNAGVVFELTQHANVWIETVLHNFNQHSGDGNGPSNSVAFDAAGNLYGMTIGGGSHGRGTAFELTPTAGGAWTETMLNNFSGQGAGGYFPNSGPLFVNGNMYGIAASGGRNNQGTVFEVAP